jgi:hypothetical protein
MLHHLDQVEPDGGLGSGQLIHCVAGDAAIGLNSQKVESALSSPFFVTFFEAELGRRSIANDFIGIQIGLNKKSAKAF